jgi:hypothetical protein
MNFSKTLLAIALSLASFAASASPATDALGSCFTDHTTGKERKDLAKWVFIAMSAHPELATLFPLSQPMRDAADKNMAALMTKLMTKDCVEQLRVALAEDSEASQASFNMLYQAAMQELMSDPKVEASIQSFMRYMDQEQLRKVMTVK